ncbi:hypothetical protein GCM10009087_54420 [Sphingomonas oligophenolica]|uniref:Band 7 protein n=1 Tax=Sphingomonas oligophenolica TaxID=301154 RepID=A0ABU9YCM9_9SPHN
MANIRNFGYFAQLRSDASSHIIRFRNGRIRQSGRGLVFWFSPKTASIAELPMDGGTVFADGIEQDHIGFDWGRQITIAAAEQSLLLITG